MRKDFLQNLVDKLLIDLIKTQFISDQSTNLLKNNILLNKILKEDYYFHRLTIVISRIIMLETT